MVELLPLVIWFSSFSFKFCGWLVVYPSFATTQGSCDNKQLPLTASDKDSRGNTILHDSTVGWVKARQTLPSQAITVLWACSLGIPSPHMFSLCLPDCWFPRLCEVWLGGSLLEKGQIKTPHTSLIARFSPVSWINVPEIVASLVIFQSFEKNCFWHLVLMFSLQLWRNGFTEIFTLPSLLIYDLFVFVNVFSIMNNKNVCIWEVLLYLIAFVVIMVDIYVRIYIYTKYGNDYR